MKATLSVIQPWFAGLGFSPDRDLPLDGCDVEIEVSQLASNGLSSELQIRWRAGAAALSAQMARRCFLEGNAGTMSQLAARGDAAGKQDYDSLFAS